MERSYAEPITLEELSRICSFTPSYIIRLFKEAFGSTPIQYLQELRLNAAICYLETTDLPIQEIAEMTGFSNLHYFSRLFKAKLGDSPSAWRKKWLVRMPGSG
ncbi:AraC family transcriptional regulator [Cohnella ginsengisoli]|uniref:AraC family transcriptional regulator n=1 Tax=Cohnella ginsengisoli TaxID=425004 RepID=A0A9X4KDT3_9BACL|nr:AraC family transcriptional regulator [Cohnella ginsengisoli]MDG0790181.1 AraC family transcriptional regulator [Cohnella ginsengisoli]